MNMAAWTVWLVLASIVLYGKDSGAQDYDCGRAPLNSRIVGGEDTPEGNWPWQVIVHVKRYYCGGTLINNQSVLTAAHCIVTPNASSSTVYLGKQTQNGSNPNEVMRRVVQIYIHPQYNIGERFDNDIALLRLESPVNFTNYIQPVCLAGSASVVHKGTNSWATGWGRINDSVSLDPPGTLQEVEVPVIGNRECSCNFLRTDGAITDNMICAGQLGKGVCMGDSGGPLQVKQGSVWVQMGISSFMVPCAVGYPDVFTRVSRFQGWIESNVGTDNVGFVKVSSSGTDEDDSFVCPDSSASALSTPLLLLPLLTLIGQKLISAALNPNLSPNSLSHNLPEP